MYVEAYICYDAIIAIKGNRSNSFQLDELDAIDQEILAIMVTKWRTSSYSIWAQMKTNAQLKGEGAIALHYKNVNKRVAKLAKAGLLKGIFPSAITINVHGRRDFIVTIKGIRKLIPFIITHPDEIEKVIGYARKFEINPLLLKKALLDNFLVICDSIYKFETELKKSKTDNALQRRILSLRKQVLLTYLSLENELEKS